MRKWKSSRCFGLLLSGVSATLVGCEQSSHSTVHSYEYSESGRTERPVYADEIVHEPPPSEYRMTAPGEMAAPGEMVPPGRAVVEPRRNP